MKRFVLFGLFVSICSCGYMSGGTTVFPGKVVVSATAAGPTCATSTTDGELCVAGDIETNANIDVAGNATVTGNLSVGGSTTNAGIYTGTNSETIGNEVDDRILFSSVGGSYNETFYLDLDATTNEVAVGSASGVTRFDFGTIGVKTSKALMTFDKIRYCGQGANGTTASYIGPVVEGDYATDMTFGGTACDGRDSTTEATADAAAVPWAWSAVAMVCWAAAGGTDDVYTFQARDDTADITGLTCTITLDGTAQGCSVILDAPVAVAAASTTCVKESAATNDNMSSIDTECIVYYVLP